MSAELKKPFIKVGDATVMVYMKSQKIIEDERKELETQEPGNRSGFVKATPDAIAASEIVERVSNHEEVMVNGMISEDERLYVSFQDGNMVNLPVAMNHQQQESHTIPIQSTPIQESVTKCPVDTVNSGCIADQMVNPAECEPPQIYHSKSISNVEFTACKCDAEMVAKMLADTGRIRVYQEQIYFLKERPQKYVKLNQNEPQRLIDLFVKVKKINLSPKNYDEVKRCLLYNHEIYVRDKTIFPCFIWAYQDGLRDIRTGKEIPMNEDCFYTACLACIYDPYADCPYFDDFLVSITGGDQKLIQLIWKIIGYLLADDIQWKKYFVFRGVKDTGKSLLANVICALLEPQDVMSLGISEIGKKFTIAEIENAKLTLCMDLTDEVIDSQAVGAIKAITGGDSVRSEAKYKTGKRIQVRSRFLFGTNHGIRTQKTDPAFEDRRIEIPFLYPVPPEKQDKNLLEKLKRELPGIALKASKAYLKLVEDLYRGAVNNSAS